MSAESDWQAATRQADDLHEIALEDFTRAQGELAGEFYADVVDTSPVRFGYYRSSHVAAVGDSSGPRENLYEHPERPPSDGPFPPREILEAPDVGAAQAAFAEAGGPGEVLWVEDAIAYAGFLEYGTAMMEPRLIYTAAASRIEGRAAARAAELSQKRTHE